MRVLGIDPGLEGALVRVRHFEGLIGIENVLVMPTLETRRGKHVLDLHVIASTLRAWYEVGAVAYIERVGARPGQGVTSMFTFGRGLGALEGMLVAIGYRIETVEPGVWKRRFKLSADKAESLLAAKRVFAESAHLFVPTRLVMNKKQAIGAAEAALIARLGLERELRLIGQGGSLATREHLIEEVAK